MGELNRLYDNYEASLARRQVSRCPLTGEVVTFIVDQSGLEGPYWDCERPIRPVQDLPQTVVAYSGALNQDEFDPDIPHGILPGPGRPYVIPRLMELPGMKAVVSHLKVGASDAYLTFYFHRDPLYEFARINVWGAQYYAAEWQRNCSYLLNLPDMPYDFDYDLAPFFENGNLFWIAPADDALQLRSTAFDCPFQNLNGRDFPVYCHRSIVESSLNAALSMS